MGKMVLGLALMMTALTAHGLPAAAQTLAAADMRPSQSLDGAWHWSIDPYRDGVTGFHGDPAGPSTRRWADTVQAEIAAKNPTTLFEFDMQQSPQTHLPGSWIGHAPEMRLYQGLVWYQRTFNFAPQPGKRVFLRFGAADYAASVYLNGKPVGEHRGGFTPFAFEVTDKLRAGSNQITLGVDSARTDMDVPPPVTDWETYGGITRSATLIAVPETYIDDAFIRLTPQGRIAASIKVDGAQPSVPLTVRIPALGVAIRGHTDGLGRWTGNAAAPAALKRWSPDSPMLYDVRIEAGEDTLTDRIGFRTIEVQGPESCSTASRSFCAAFRCTRRNWARTPSARSRPQRRGLCSRRSSRV